MVKKIVNNEFVEAETAEFAVVDFSAEWCGPCKMLAPVMDELSEEMSGKVEFFNADVDNNFELAQRFGITSIPALILFKKGQQQDMSVGFMPKAAVKEFIEAKLS